MLFYATLGVSDLARSRAFFDPVMAALGQPGLPDWADGWAGYGQAYDAGFCLCLCPPSDGRVASPGNGTMRAFRCECAATVDAAHAAGLIHGGRDEGAPGPRLWDAPGLYAAYLHDRDANKLAFMHHRWQGQ